MTIMRGKLSNPNLILEEIPESERSQNLSQNEDEDDAMDDGMDDGILFTKKMRIETRKIHNISDTLVNAKLGLAMSDDKIWAEGLLIFYEIFKFLEAAMLRLSPKLDPFNRIQKVIAGVERTKAFEQDLEFYYSPGYLQSYQIRPTVSEYLKHLKMLESREPIRLLAYIYHLYMGLLSGGQILKKKRDFKNRLKSRFSGVLQWLGIVASPPVPSSNGSSSGIVAKPGDAVTTFLDGRSIADIKKEIAYVMNDIAADFSRDEKNSVLEESLEVFRRNNEIVGSINRTTMAILKSYATYLILIISVGAAVYLYWSNTLLDSY